MHAFRNEDQFVNSANEFQNVTQVSDSLLQLISPFFKFPDWTKDRTMYDRGSANNKSKEKFDNQKKSIQIKDLNRATAEELKTINGIGEKLSQRIIKFRNRLGGGLVDDQLSDVYGLEPEVVNRTLLRFKVVEKPTIVKININESTVDEISKLIYLRYDVAARIVEYREFNGTISSFDELTKIEGFPIDKIHRIKLYLTL